MVVPFHHRQLSSFDALRVSINTGALKYTFSEATILIAVVVIVNVIRNIMRNEGGGREGAVHKTNSIFEQMLFPLLLQSSVQKRWACHLGAYGIYVI